MVLIITLEATVSFSDIEKGFKLQKMKLDG